MLMNQAKGLKLASYLYTVTVYMNRGKNKSFYSEQKGGDHNY